MDASKLNWDPIEDNSTTNTSKHEEMNTLLTSFLDNRSLDPPMHWTLIILYTIVTVIGSVENAFVVTAVVRKPAMRTARNMFILNLAISDLLLCLITAPFTLSEIVSKHWPMIRWAFLCRIIGILQGTSIFVSTITIIAIALDRYQVIVNPTKKSLDVGGSMLVLLIIWILAAALVSPIYIFRDLKTFPTGLAELEFVSFCVEEWPIENGRAYYSAFSLVVQYLIPIVIVSSAYQQIYLKLKNRYRSTNLGADMKKEMERDKKMQKTNALLIAIAVVYGVSWLPLNLLNLISDIKGNFMDKKNFLLLFSFCHLMGMSSACSNPLLYGWLNENFRKEFAEILSCKKSSNFSGATSTIRRRDSPDMTQNAKFELQVLKNNKCHGVELSNAYRRDIDTDTEISTLAR